MNAETYKREAAAGALDFVKSGMRLGLGTGSTARPFVELLGDRVRAGLDIIAVPTSEATRSFCPDCGTPLTFEHEDFPDEIDVTTCSLDRPELARPKDHTWTSSKVSWLTLTDGLPDYAEGKSEE